MRTSTFLLTVVALSACSSTEGPRAPSVPPGGTLIITPVADAAEVFPVYVNDVTGRIVQDQVFDRLAEIKSGLQTIGDQGFEPRLAKSWAWAPDSLSIAFSLDPRARWHDGKPVVARDVRYSFLAFTDSVIGSPVRPLLSNIDSVSIRDSLTPVVWFKKRTPEQFYDIAYQLVVMPEHVYGSIPAQDLHSSLLIRTPIGSGRFRFVRWEPGTRIELLSDTGNYRGRAALDRVIFSPADPPTAATQLLAGETDFVESFPANRASELDDHPVAKSVIAPTASYVFFAFNHNDPKVRTKAHAVLGDRRVRRALAMAIDRSAMLTNVFQKNGRIGFGPFPASYSYADTTLRLPPFDTTAAKALLDSAGWTMGANGIRSNNGRPLRFSVVVPSVSAQRQQYAVLLQAALRKVGAQLDIDIVDTQVLTELSQSGNFDSILWGFGPDPSPAGTKQIWGSGGIGRTGQNVLRYSNPLVDALLDSATTTFDAARMKQYTKRAFQQIIDDVPAVFLYDITLVRGVHRRVNVAEMRVDEWWANLADWTIAPDKRIKRDSIGLREAIP